jgi:lysophospholipase L1-like esterase
MADGYAVVAMSVLPFGASADWSSARQAELETLNSTIAAYSGPTIVDTYAAFGQSESPAILDPTYDSSDGKHLNQAGYDRLADLIYAAITP